MSDRNCNPKYVYSLRTSIPWDYLNDTFLFVKGIIALFNMFIFMWNSLAQLSIFFSYVSICSSLTIRIMSSAYIRQKLYIFSRMGSVIKLKSMGLVVRPCGTPEPILIFYLPICINILLWMNFNNFSLPSVMIFLFAMIL